MKINFKHRVSKVLFFTLLLSLGLSHHSLEAKSNKKHTSSHASSTRSSNKQYIKDLHTKRLTVTEKAKICGDLKVEQRTQTLTLELSDSFLTPLGLPFEITVTYQVIGNAVSLHIPAFSFELPEATPGFVFTLDGFLPRKIWPNDPLYQSFFAGNDNEGDNFQVHVTNAGSLIFLATEGLFFTPGAHQVQATTVTYFLTGSICDHKPPKNVQASSGPSNVVGTDNNVLPFDYLEFHQISIYNDRFAIWWPDNARDLSPQGRNHLSLVVRTGTFKNSKCGKSEIVFDGPPVVAINAPEGVFFVEGAITINPTNPNNIFVASVVGDYRVTPGQTKNNVVLAQEGNPVGQREVFQYWTAVSFDKGKTWTATRRDGTPGYPNFPLDGRTPTFDKFGNLWTAGIAAADGQSITNFLNGFTTGGLPGVPITFGVSTDGGQTFQDVAPSPVPLPVPINTATQFFNLQDYPKATFGGDGQGGYAFYLNTTYVLINFDGTGQLSKYLTYVPVQGFNNFGTVVSLQIPQTLVTQDNPLEINLTASEIVVSDQGKIMLWGIGANFCCLSPENVHQCVVDTTGVVNFDLPNKTTDTAFSGPFAAAKTNIGGSLSVVPFQPVRGLLPQGFGMAYDPDIDRFYAALVDEQPLGSGDMVVYLLFSDNNGQTWSQPVLIADRIKKARGNVNMHRDPVSGNILFAWQDARGQKNQEEVNTFIAIMTKKQLDKLPGGKSCCGSRPCSAKH